MKRRRPDKKQLRLSAEKIRDLVAPIDEDKLGDVAGGRLRPTAVAPTQDTCC